MGDEALLCELVGVFDDDSQTQLMKLENVMDSGRVELVRELAHSIKGAARNLSAWRLAENAKELESAARDNNLQRARMLTPVVLESMRLTIAAFQDCLEPASMS